jgi:hypothetical protein
VPSHQTLLASSLPTGPSALPQAFYCLLQGLLQVVDVSYTYILSDTLECAMRVCSRGPRCCCADAHRLATMQCNYHLCLVAQLETRMIQGPRVRGTGMFDDGYLGFECWAYRPTRTLIDRK